jgi:hypothetical protein
MSLIIPANSITGGYAVDNSCRFNDGSSDTLSKTFGSASSSNTTFTVSAWVKRAKLSANQDVVSAFQSSSGLQTDLIRFGSADDLEFYAHTTNSSGNADIQTNRLFRDVGAWYHIVLALDTTQATASNRVKIYVNGVQETSFSTENYMNQNGTIIWGLGSGTEHTIGAVGTSNYFGGYVAEVCYIDGSQLDPTSFGEFDEDSGIWKPKSVSGLTFGTNGFYLDFEDSAALGDDVSGNGNDFTVNNLTAIDQTTDTCTNNFITMNPLDSYYSASTFSEGNLKIVTSSSNYSPDMGTIGLSAGKWYWEVKIDTTSTEDMVGITGNQRLSSASSTSHLGGMLYDFAYNSYARFYNNNSFVSYGATFGSNDIIGVALDLDSGTNTIQFYKNGAAQGSKNITHVSSTENGFYNVSAGDFTSGASMTFSSNFGNPTFTISSGNTDGNGYGNFEYAPPSGYLSLCTSNLSGVL